MVFTGSVVRHCVDGVGQALLHFRSRSLRFLATASGLSVAPISRVTVFAA